MGRTPPPGLLSPMSLDKAKAPAAWRGTSPVAILQTNSCKASIAEGRIAALGNTVQNLSRNFFGEGTRRWARTRRTWELGRIPMLEETLKQLDGFW